MRNRSNNWMSGCLRHRESAVFSSETGGDGIDILWMENNNVWDSGLLLPIRLVRSVLRWAAHTFESCGYVTPWQMCWQVPARVACNCRCNRSNPDEPLEQWKHMWTVDTSWPQKLSYVVCIASIHMPIRIVLSISIAKYQHLLQSASRCAHCHLRSGGVLARKGGCGMQKSVKYWSQFALKTGNPLMLLVHLEVLRLQVVQQSLAQTCVQWGAILNGWTGAQLHEKISLGSGSYLVDSFPFVLEEGGDEASAERRSAATSAGERSL